jgi:hypothetical protein
MSGYLHVSTPARLPQAAPAKTVIVVRDRQCALGASRLRGGVGWGGVGAGNGGSGAGVEDTGF